ncbi:MAG TPA: RNA 2',3'-cyclic phosphodiesterase [Sedimentisphaerales bacterium]|nr:RNA 2',3'-cyclic phosphodiesterase [Sedimentisphaerales bacterium]
MAIELDESIIEAAGDLQDEMRGVADLERGEVKWVKPEAMHLTLKFLGEVDGSRIAEICDIVGKTAHKHSSFRLEVEGAGSFGKPAKVLWMGVAKNERLTALQKDIEKSLAKAGWPEEERAFASHLTLCRINSSFAGRKLAEIADDYKDTHFGSFAVDSVCVLQSELSTVGPRYTMILKKCKLKDA